MLALSLHRPLLGTWWGSIGRLLEYEPIWRLRLPRCIRLIDYEVVLANKHTPADGGGAIIFSILIKVDCRDNQQSESWSRVISPTSQGSARKFIDQANQYVIIRCYVPTTPCSFYDHQAMTYTFQRSLSDVAVRLQCSESDHIGAYWSLKWRRIEEKVTSQNAGQVWPRLGSYCFTVTTFTVQWNCHLFGQ